MKKIIIFIFVSMIVSTIFGITSNAATTQTSVSTETLPTCKVNIYTPKTGNPYAIFTVNIPKMYKVSSKVVENSIDSAIILVNPKTQDIQFIIARQLVMNPGWYGTKSIRLDAPVKAFKKGDSMKINLKFTAENGRKFDINDEKIIK